MLDAGGVVCTHVFARIAPLVFAFVVVRVRPLRAWPLFSIKRMCFNVPRAVCVHVPGSRADRDRDITTHTDTRAQTHTRTRACVRARARARTRAHTRRSRGLEVQRSRGPGV